MDLLQPFYDDSTNYFPAIKYQNRNSEDHLTHCTYNTNEDDRFWDRKLDYLFTNYQDQNWSSTGSTHQDAFHLSDHAPVSATLTFP